MAHRFTLRQLSYFVAVGEAGSIAVASRRLHVSSPSISAAIGQLEEEWGLPLFVRQHAQGLSPTLAGRQMLEQARAVLREADALRDRAGDISGSVRGPLAIGCLQTLAPAVLPALRRSFAAAYPEVRASQRELDQAEIFSLLRRGEIDVALTYDLDLPPDLDFEPVARLSPYAILGASHPLAGLPEVAVEELAQHPMVLLDLPFSSEYFLSFFLRAGLRAQVAERTRDMGVMRSLVANGFGFSIANVRPVSDAAPDGRPLRFVPLAGPVRAIEVGVLMAAGAGTTHVIRAFVDHCRERQEAGDVPGLGDRLDACPEA